MLSEEIQVARRRLAQARQRAHQARDELNAAREVVRGLELGVLRDAAASGDLDRCLSAAAAAQVAYCGECSQVIDSYLASTIDSRIVQTWETAFIDGRKVLVPALGDFGPGVSEGSGTALLAVLDRFGVVFDYPQIMTFESYGMSDHRLTVNRADGTAVLERYVSTRQDMVTVASGPLEDVLRHEVT